MALFQTRFVLIKDNEWRKNWYPESKTFVKKDDHSPASVSINFANSNVVTLPKADQNLLFCLGIPLGMECKAVLTENRVIVTEIKK
jgi:hypothetical protein